jgi:hypothetical protein
VLLPSISLKRTLQVFVRGRQKKQVERLFFCIGIIRFDLAVHMMFLFHIAFFNKKKIGENLEDFSCLLAYQILLVFSPDLSILCALIYSA